ncbi:PP2C family protein-serine/threonine phosphatase [Kineococcus esterisolvens]|uniref:PP2C family protein-serine/threonine phosphatase n=1 Tax=unclassified Kineococcus TaxID=2621656 RepID=UPI003D7C3C64
MLAAVEAAAPVDTVRVFARELRRQVDAVQVSFLIANFSARSLTRLTQSATQGPGERAPEQVPLSDDVLPYERAVLTQQVQIVPEGAGARLLAPVSTRGDAMGVLELLLPAPADDDVRALIKAAANTLALVITAERRHTDLYEWGNRITPLVLAAEIQHRLLPDAFTCEAGTFTLAAWLEPAGNIGGDTFDYSLDRTKLFLSITDAMGHQVEAALLATLAVGSLRNSRRAGADLVTMAGAANRAIEENSSDPGFVTGLLMSVDLRDGSTEIVNAGHPPPLLQRGGEVRPLQLTPDLPLGIRPDLGYQVQHFQLQPGDRLILLTDGMLERNAEHLDLAAFIADHAADHPRQLIQALTAAVEDAVGGELADDATVMCLHWHGPA